MEPLIRALEDTDVVVRERAARALGEILAVSKALNAADRRRGRVALASSVADPEIKVRYEATRSIGEPKVEALCEVGRKYGVSRLLAALEIPSGGERWEREEVERIRYYVVQALGELRDPAAARPLVSILDESSGACTLHEACAIALGRIGDRCAVEPLLRHLGTGQVGIAAAEALAEIGDPRAVEPLLNLAVTYSYGDYWKVKRPLMKFKGYLTVDALTARLKQTKSGDYMRFVAEVLEELGDASLAHAQTDAVVSMLIEKLSNESLEIRGRYHDDYARGIVMALGALGSERAVPFLIRFLADDELARSVYRTLEKMIQRGASRMSNKTLHTLAGISDSVSVDYSAGECGSTRHNESKVDCAPIRQLARQELIRRGVRA